MLVYGDWEREASPRARLRDLAGLCAAAAALPPGVLRHALLCQVLIEAGELAQGLCDARFQARGRDEVWPELAPLMCLLVHAARQIHCSWQTGFQRGRIDAGLVADLERRLGELPERVVIRRPEGYAHYALYPEAYLAAASALRATCPGPLQVIGVRSIGTSLGAAVAAALGGAPFFTVRPVGEPFARTISLSPALTHRLRAGPGWAIVDEGPGLSGSSMGAVADLLEDHGGLRTRLYFFPSHAGLPGEQVSERHRRRYLGARRHVVEADQLLLCPASPGGGLAGWAADLIGPAEAPPEDLGAGRWRRHLYDDRGAWPGVDVCREQRKYLLTAGGRRHLLKFAGLGRCGQEKLARAQALHEAGLGLPVRGLRHGFLAFDWLDGWRPLTPGGGDRRALIAYLARYLKFRARRFPATSADGATPAVLLHMARRNTERALGHALAREFGRLTDEIRDLAGRVHPVRTDNKLQAFEFLVSPQGGLVKCDALDHAADHDLIGAQDLAWDVAGAAFELRLSAEEQEALVARLDVPWAGPRHLPFYRVCYLAFQIGRHTLARAACDPEEAARLDTALFSYRAALRAALIA